MKALVRGIPASFTSALSREAGPLPDVATARAEHATYVRTLQDLGVEVVALPADEALPDGCFVEDTVVVLGGSALITRSAVASRAGERASVAEAMAAYLDVRWMPVGTHLDGGDVMVTPSRVYVGQSARTDAAGIGALRRFAEAHGRQLHVLPVAQHLHLKSACSVTGRGEIVLADGFLDASVFAEPTLVVDAPSGVEANVVGVGDSVLVAAHAPAVADALAARGYAVHKVPTTQVNLVDGALTCCSVLFEGR